jgi:hypothetical protein
MKVKIAVPVLLRFISVFIKASSPMAAYAIQDEPPCGMPSLILVSLSPQNCNDLGEEPRTASTGQCARQTT